MTLWLHDTLRGEKCEFEPLTPGRVTMYVCGPTVYNYAHIGNARPPVVFDVLARLLRRSYELVYARNITDVDDKINEAAREAGVPIGQITGKFVSAYVEDMRALGVADPDIAPHATDHIDDMIAMTAQLIATGHAYEAEGHVLFDVTSFERYGALSKRDLREMIAGARVEVAPYKRNPADFVLWKPSPPDLPGWDSPWGRGRPGWHLECSAMSERHLGETIDIHGGGQDLVFPHHENEIAQSVCAHGGKPFARYWLHNGFLNIDSTKMSKSLGNVTLVRELLRQAPGEAIRLALLSAHYRQPLDWTEAGLAEARRKLDRLYGALQKAQAHGNLPVVDPPPAVLAALEDDLNTPQALAEMFAIARAINRSDDVDEQRQLGAGLLAAGGLTGLLQSSPAEWFAGDAPLSDDRVEAIEALIARRAEAKASRDFETADRLRDELTAMGIAIQDGADGTRWRQAAAEPVE